MLNFDPLRFTRDNAGGDGDFGGDERVQLIASAAFFISEKRHFAPGYEVEDWLKAEAEVEKMLAERALAKLRKGTPPSP